MTDILEMRWRSVRQLERDLRSAQKYKLGISHVRNSAAYISLYWHFCLTATTFLYINFPRLIQYRTFMNALKFSITLKPKKYFYTLFETFPGEFYTF